jgi:hypothetical protein
MDARGIDIVRGVRVSVREDASAFSYSILVTATFGASTVVAAPVSVPRLFLFVLGATLGFAVAEAVVSRGFTMRIREERGDVVILGSALAPVSVCAGLAVAIGAVHLVTGAVGWFVAPFGGTVTYITLAGLQMAAAHRYEERHPPAEEDDGGRDRR